VNSGNSGKFCRFVNKRLHCKSGVGALHDRKCNRTVASDQEKANLLNDYFASIGVIDDGKPLDVSPTTSRGTKLQDSITFTPDKLRKVMRKIKGNSSPGADGYPPVLLQNLSHSLAQPLSVIFASFMSTGHVPQAWKQATVTPVFKGGIASDQSNYRPISLMSVFSKLMEKVVVLDMLRYCKEQGLISKQQHGFLARKSTVTNMLSCMNDWTCALMNRSSVAVAYIDFQKAFDSVCHTKLFCKLESIGFTGNLLQWIANFLTDRWQCTRVGNFVSDPARIISGVIQGSCIGPLLFLLYVNSLINIFDNDVTCHLFADDVKLYTVIKTPTDCTSLQKGLDKVYDWSVAHQLPISVRKCSCIV